MRDQAVYRGVRPKMRRAGGVGAEALVEALVEEPVVLLDVLRLRMERQAEDALDAEPPHNASVERPDLGHGELAGGEVVLARGTLGDLLVILAVVTIEDRRRAEAEDRG